MPEGPHDTANIRAASGGSSRSYIAQVAPLNTQMGLRGEDTSNSAREGVGIGDIGDPALTLQAAHGHGIITPWQVRRLTPRECERLQGFPDDFTLIPTKTRRKLEADEMGRLRAMSHAQMAELYGVDPATFTGVSDDDLRRLAADGLRYKALGNSWAVNCAEHIGERIQLMEARHG